MNGGFEHVTLEVQHRMAPNISRFDITESMASSREHSHFLLTICRLVLPLYPNLRDAERVHSYPGVRGILSNMFFLDHQNSEKDANDEGGGSSGSHGETFVNFLSYTCSTCFEVG